MNHPFDPHFDTSADKQEAAHNDDLPSKERDRAMRPRLFSEFVGQKAISARMLVYVQAAKERSEALDHLLLHGPPGLGKTTIANIVANEMGSEILQTSGPVLVKRGDLAALLTRLNPLDVLFIDEIHRIDTHLEEILYPAMEDYQLDFMIGEGPVAKSVKLRLPPFTLIGATTKIGLLSAPLRDRFGIHQRMEFYGEEDLSKILIRACELFNMPWDKDAILTIARCARGTPRIAHRLLRRIRDYVQIQGHGRLTLPLVRHALEMMEVDRYGLDQMDRRFLSVLIERFGGGPAGIESLATSLNEEVATLEDVVEPFLVQQGLVKRTPSGRQILEKAFSWLGLDQEKAIKQGTLGIESDK